MDEDLNRKLRILADAAKYDASCASSGAKGRKAAADGIGSTTGAGICHAYTPDGRCVSLLKILLTNYCLFDCAYCINRRSSNVARARFSVEEVVRLTMAFYRRNYIEGLFLSSGIVRSPDHTMEQLVLVARTLRQRERFAGYIHLKTIPEAAPWLIEQAGLFADRLSINVELPSETGLKALAPEKNSAVIDGAMGQMKARIAEAKEEKRRFAPAGQSTQMVVGATPETDWQVLQTATEFYKNYALKRVYYSGYIPVNQDDRVPLLNSRPPLMRENRLYQADWLMRFYGFSVGEIVNAAQPDLDMEIDPKLGWALRHPQFFPVDLNRADFKTIIRVPGIGRQSAQKIIATRQFGKIYVHQLQKMGIAYNRAQYFITCADALNRYTDKDPQQLRALILKSGQSKYLSSLVPQLSLFQ